MNHDDFDRMHDDVADSRLRLALRGLRRDTLPERDLWPQLAARLAQAPRQVAAPRTRHWMPALALAASLVLAVGIAWQLRPASRPDPSAQLIQREAQAMTREYRAALFELERSAPPPAASPVAPALDDLDRSAAQIRTALARDPDARFLLERLRRTYAQRLALTQRAALT
ncbi:MAG TPA: hypothetical protein VLM17_09925 [Xanthomonadaceae bacterium]|nr:hypothetical protein [Xanthomonadaceae bacterium]